MSGVSGTPHRRGRLSESQMIRDVQDLIARAVRSISRVKSIPTVREGLKLIVEAQTYLYAMEELASRGIHANPAGAVSRNPASADDVMSHHVMAIVYVHRQDGRLYCHGFGDADIKLVARGDALSIRGLKTKTDVRAVAREDGSVVLAHSKPGVSIWQEFSE